MASHTPLFDEALRTHLAELTPGTRICPERDVAWEFTEAMKQRCEAYHVPPSTLAPLTRLQHTRVFMCGPDFYQRVLKDGRSLITTYDPDSPVSLLSSKEWNQEQLQDGLLRFGQKVDPSQPFFEQWERFSKSVPRPALLQDGVSENSDWSAFCIEVKNDYYGYSCSYSNDCFYCEYQSADQHCVDLTACDRAQWSYDCVRSDDISQVFWSERCFQSVNLTLCLNCDNCQDCFGCTNLKNKRYCFLNEQLTKEDYLARVAAIDLGDHSVVQQWRERIYRELWQKADRRALFTLNTERSLGDDLIESRDVEGVSLGECERTYNAFGMYQAKDCTDIIGCLQTERCHYSQHLVNGYEVRFSSFCTSCVDVEYSELLTDCEHCFGCIGLTKKKFCIFNVQYTEEAYWPLVDALKTAMLKRGEYGEFFPYSSSLVAYNSSNADIFFPLSKEEVVRRGARWFDFSHPRATQSMAETHTLPNKLQETTDEVLTQSFVCEASGRRYRIVKPELEWHRKFNLALPRLHPTVRRKLRSTEMYPLTFSETTCAECAAKTQTRIPLSRGYRILCEPCYVRKQLA